MSKMHPLLQKGSLEMSEILDLFPETAEDTMESLFPCRSKHPAWRYFARLKRGTAVCLLCTVAVHSACSTKLARHIVKHHPSTALQMQKAWLLMTISSLKRKKEPQRRATAAMAAGRSLLRGGGASPSSFSSAESPAAAIAATSPEKKKRMNCDGGDPGYNLLVNPYSSAAMMGGSGLGQPLLTVGLGEIAAGGCSWLPYQDLRSLDASSAYETEVRLLSLGCPELTVAVPKYETVKYEYAAEIQAAEKSFDSEPRLYHKEEIKIEEDLEKSDEKSSNSGDSIPVKRGRPTENPCWNYFYRLDDQNVRCKLCSKVVKSACATNMTKHLERHHQHDYQHLIVQIRQYRYSRSSKGPPLASSSELAHILPNGYSLKSDAYPDIYGGGSSTEADLSVYAPQTSYERALQESGIWNRQPWSQWHTGQQLETAASIDTRTSGVIIHGNAQSWASTSSAPTAGGPEKPYMKRNRKTEHPVWEYFKRTQDGNAQCGICSGVVKSPCSSNFMRHLMRHHSSEYNTVYLKWVQKRGPGPAVPIAPGASTITAAGLGK